MNKKSLLLGIKLFTTWLLIVAFAAAIMSINTPIVGLIIACAFVGAAAKLQEKVLFD